MRASVEKRVDDVEVLLLEQEHRLISILQNLYFTFNKYRDSREKKLAIYKSIIIKIFSPSSILIGGVGIVALLGLLVAIRANYLLEQQNIRIDTQNYLIEAERRASLIFELTSILEQIQREIDSAGKTKKQTDVVETKIQFDIDEDEEGDEKNDKVIVSKYTKGRIVALSRSLRPYRFLELPRDSSSALSIGNEGDKYEAEELEQTFLYVMLQGMGVLPTAQGPKLNYKDMSPERGQLLLSLYSSNVKLVDVIAEFPDFSRSVLDGSVLASTDLSNIHLTGSSIKDSDLTDTVFQSAFLGDVDFTNSRLSGVNLSGCVCLKTKFVNVKNLTGAKFSRAKDYAGSDFTNSNLEGMLVSSEKWLEDLMNVEPSVVGIKYNKWKIKKLDQVDIDEDLHYEIMLKADNG